MVISIANSTHTYDYYINLSEVIILASRIIHELQTKERGLEIALIAPASHSPDA